MNDYEMSSRRKTNSGRRFSSSSLFSPAKLFTVAEAAWYRADMGTSTTGANLDSIADKSGRAHTLSFFTNKPTLVTDGGLPAIRMDGTTAQVVRTTAPASGAFAYTLFAVMKIDTVAVAANYLFGCHRARGCAIGAVSGNYLIRHTGFTNITGSAVDTANYKTIIATGGNASPFTPKLWINGVLQTNSPVGAQSYGNETSAGDFISIGFDAASTKGFIRECGWIDRQIADSEAAQLHAYLSTSWPVA